MQDPILLLFLLFHGSLFAQITFLEAKGYSGFPIKESFRRCWKFLSLFCAVVLVCVNTNAQEVAFADSGQVGIRVTTKPLQYIFLDFPIVIEKRFNRHSVTLELAYRAATSDSAEVKSQFIGLWDAYTFNNYTNPLYQAFTVGVGYRYYFTKRMRHKTFVGPEFYYRLWWINDKWAKFDSYFDGGDFEGWRRDRKHVYGIKMLIGKAFVFNVRTKVKPVIEVYGGIGFRGFSFRFETRNGSVAGDEVELDVRKGWSIVPSIQGGFRIGFGL